jgi:hypothetical protein
MIVSDQGVETDTPVCLLLFQTEVNDAIKRGFISLYCVLLACLMRCRTGDDQILAE